MPTVDSVNSSPWVDPYFVNIQEFEGCNHHKSSSLPPPYDGRTNHFQASAPEIKQDIKVNLPVAIDHCKPESKLKWKEFMAACDTAKMNLNASLIDLKQNRFKNFVLKEEKVQVQQHIEEGLIRLQAVREAAHMLYTKHCTENVDMLQNALRELGNIKSAIPSTPIPSHPFINNKSENCWWLKIIKDYLGPVALMGWGLIVQSGILSSDAAKTLPLIGGFIAFLLKLKENIETCTQQNKTEDLEKLTKIYDILMEIFMSDSRIDEAYSRFLASRQLLDDTNAKIQESRSAMAGIQSGVADMQSEVANMQSGVANMQSEVTNMQSGVAELRSVTGYFNQLLNSSLNTQLNRNDSTDFERRLSEMEQKFDKKLEDSVNLIINSLKKQLSNSDTVNHENSNNPA